MLKSFNLLIPNTCTGDIFSQADFYGNLQKGKNANIHGIKHNHDKEYSNTVNIKFGFSQVVLYFE